MSAHGLNPLERLLHLDRSSPEFNDDVSNILHGDGYRECVQRAGEGTIMELANFLDNALDILSPDSPGSRKCLRELRQICSSRTILPTSYTFLPQDLLIGKLPAASGGSGDVFEGIHDGSKVCVKRVRVYSRDGPLKAEKTLYQEAVMWKRLKHKNIVPLLGITTNPLQLVSKWMDGGELGEYIGKHPDVSRIGLISDVAEGLNFLHTNNIIHGDLKGPNILVDESGHAQITDFGVATVTQNLDSIRSLTGENAHTARWTAPEILNEKGSYSKEADVFSFAMVMIEVFTGDVPFGCGNLAAAATLAIMEGKRPSRPTHPKFTDDLWVLVEKCWDQEPLSRPEVSWILEVLGCPGPPLRKPYLQGVTGSSSTIKLQQIRTVFQNPAAQYTQSLGKTISTPSHSVPPVPPQPLDYSTPATPYKDLGFDVEGTSPSETSSPLLRDPLTDNFDDRFRDYTGGGREFRADLPSGDRGVSRSTFHLPGDAQGLGSSTRNNSRAGLLGDSDLPARLGHSKADLQNTIAGGGSLSRRSSERQPPTNGYANGDASRNDLANGTKPRNQSRSSIDDTPQENRGALSLQTKQDAEEPRSDQKGQGEPRTREMNGNHGNSEGPVSKLPKRHRFLRWFNGLICIGKGHIE